MKGKGAERVKQNQNIMDHQNHFTVHVCMDSGGLSKSVYSTYSLLAATIMDKCLKSLPACETERAG